MDWVRWIVPLIAVTVYLLSHILSNRQEAVRQQQMQRRVPPPRPSEGEEATERTWARAQEERREEARRAEARREEERVRREASRRKPPAIKPRRVQDVPRQPRKELPQPAQVVEVVPAVVVVEEVARPSDSLMQEPAAPPPDAASELVKLLREPKTLRTAILLREILDRPVSQRPRR